jgi:PTH1 family peptidyl-tRNA hydrolase
MIKLIVGLGNPGREYEATRHNAGSWFVEEAVQQHRLSFKLDKKFRLEVAEYQSPTHKVYFAKPMTYMNESGLPVAAFARFYQLHPEEILVVHDELDFVPGLTKLKHGGGHGGHNGLRDIIAHLGAADFYRLRVGIGHPGHRDQVTGFVLHAPTMAERKAIDVSLTRAQQILPALLEGQFHKAMHELHSDEV